MFLLAGSPRLICFAVAREHFDIHPVVRYLLDFASCVPVTRNGRDAVAARQLLRRLSEGHAVSLFPEGNLSGVGRNRICTGKHGAAFLALATGAPVFPVYIAGGPRTHHLLNSWVVPTPRAVRVHYGPALDLSAYYGRPRTRRLLEEVTWHFAKSIQDLASRERKRPEDKETTMTPTANDLTTKHCVPCEGGIPALAGAELARHLEAVPEWKLTPDGKRIRREWRVQDSATALDFFNRVGQIAEAEDHHPDLHLVGYRNVAIELWTHAIGGLSENDFILAAKIDRLPVALKR